MLFVRTLKNSCCWFHFIVTAAACVAAVYCFIRTNKSHSSLSSTIRKIVHCEILKLYLHRSSVRANGNLGIGHGSNRHKKDLLSPVPETSSISSGARVVEVSGPPAHNNHHPPGGLGSMGGGSAFHYSSESVQRMIHHHPADRMGDCNGDGGGPPGGERDANGHILVRGSSFSSGAASTHPPPASVLSTPLRGSMGSIASKGGRLQGDGHLHGGPNHHRPSEHGARGHVVKADIPRDTSYHSTISGAGRYGELGRKDGFNVWQWSTLNCVQSRLRGFLFALCALMSCGHNKVNHIHFLCQNSFFIFAIWILKLYQF